MSPFDSTTKQPRLPCPTRRPQSRLAAWLASVVLAAGSATASASEPGMWNTVGDGGTPSVMKHLAPTGPALQRPSALGTVGTTGEAGYSAAVELPPSLLGPSLSLRYTAGAGPGFEMGAWGWTLDGVLTLREIDEHYYTHTHPGETWFRLEGGLQGTLIPTGTAGGLEQFVAKSTASDPLRASWDPLADTWQVQTQGVTSVLEHVGFENTYRVTEQFDSWGNRVDYAYTPQGRIASIELGGNGATPHNIRVDFSYVAAAHSSRVYAGGQFSDYDQLLDEVEVSVLDGASWLRAWSYLVVHVDHDDVELVASITKVGHFAADLGPALAHYVGTFEYSALELPDVRATETPTPSLVTAVTTDTYKEGRFDPSPVSKTVVDGMMADLDGDGLTDVIESSGNTGFLPTADGGDQISGSTTVASSDWCVSYMLLDPSPETGARYYYEDECQALTGPMAAVGETVTVLGMAYTVSQLADLDGDGFVDVVTSPGTTDFSVYYGRPWDEAEPNAGPFDVEEVLESSPSWLYSRTAYAPNAMVLPIESRGTTHGLMDLSGDGFLDQVDFGGGVYYPHSGVRGGGWNATAVPMSYPFAALEQFERVRIDDPIEDARNAHDPADWDAYFHVFSHSNLARGVVELTGDGCMDAVDASTTPWQVYPGLCDGTGFSATSLSWDAPVTHLNRVTEFYPSTSYYAYGDVEGMDPLSWYGQTGEVTQQLADADGDGRVDLVIHDGVQTVFHRNVGDGFGALAYPTYVVDQDTLGTTDGTAVQGAPDHELDPFTMHAYTTATAGAGDYDGDQRLDFYDGTELRFGDRDWPFLLIEIDNGRGLTSELAYTSSGDTNGRVPLHHGGALAFGAEPTFGNRVVVSSVTTEDAVTGQRARHLYKYWRGEQHRDVFLGFGEVTETLELADDPWSSWVEQWTQGTTYALDAPELGPQPTESREWVDVNHCFAPGLASPTCTPSFEIASETFTTGSWHGEHGERWLPDVVVRHDFGDEVGLGAARVSTQSVIYDGFGRPTSISSVQPSGQTQVVDVTWAESSDGDLVAPATIAIGDGVDVLRQTSIEYDDLPAGELSHGFRTRTVRCDESPTVTACANALEWQYTADSRGQPSTTVAPTGSTTTQTWGYNGAVLEHLDNALAQRTTHLINLRGQVTGTIGIDGVGHGNTFDTLGRRTEDTIAARTTGAPWIPIRRVHFHDDSVPWFEHIEDLDDSGAVIGEVYNDKDGTGRTTRTWHAKADHTGWFRQDRLHDLAGRLVRASYTTGTALDHDADLPLDFTLTQDRNYYDGYGRLREHYDDEANGIGGRTITFPDSVSNWVERETDAEGHVTRRVRDGRGNLLSVYQAGPSGVESLRAEYGYDALDRLTSIVQPNGNTFTYHYDSLDRILRVAKGAVGSPPQDWMTYQYTGGRLTERTNNVGGFVRWLDHDALDRFTRYEVSDPVAPGGVLTYQLEYDTVVPGQLSGVLDPLGGELREYDDYARLQHHRRLFTQAPARDLLLSVERDIHGRPTQTRLPHDGAGAARITLDHVYQNGFETAVTIDHPSDPLLGSYDMLRGQSAADPRLHSVTVPQVELDVRWDRSLSPVMVDHHSFELNGVVRHDRNLDYAQNGWLLSNEHDRGHTNARFFEYDYDDLGRLETAWVDGAVASAFTFDSTGDLQSAHRQLPAPGVYTLAYPAAGTAVANQGLRHPISASGPGADEVFTRDAAGLLTAWEEVGGDVRQFEYDGLHRLRRVTLNGTTARIHTYGHDGTRLQTLQWDGGLRRDLHFGAWSETWNGSSYGRRVRVSSVLTVDITDPFDHERRWHMVELQGDASATYPDFPVSRASAIGNRTLSASGEELDGVGAPDLDATFHGAGRPAVEWTRAPVVAMGARHVAMGTLEWLAPEPLLFEGPQPLLGDPAGLDPFRYAGGNPVVYRDPTGYARQPQQIPFRGGGGSMSELAVEEELQQAGDILDFLEDFESKAADIAEARADLQAELRETWSPSRRRAIVSELADLDAVRTDYRRALRALPDMYEDVQGLAKMLDWDRAPAVLRGGLFSIMGRMGMAGAALMLGRDSFGAEVQQQWTSFEQEHSGAFTAGAMFGVLPGGQVLGAGITAASIAGAGGTFSTVNPPFLPSEGQVNPATGAPSTPRPHASSNPFGGGWVHD